MQPYFFPYIGYFQLISAVDLFIVYDNIKYTKKGWFNRNRFLQNGKDRLFSIPLKKDSDFLNVIDRELAKDFNKGRLLSQIKSAYQRAPFFAQTFQVIEQIVRYEEPNLFHYLYNSIVRICEVLGIRTEIIISSSVAIDHRLKGGEKVIALCKEVGASTYVNPIGGMDLYSKDTFRGKGLALKFLRPEIFEYVQFGSAFVPLLSIIDVMMFNSIVTIRSWITTNYELI